MMTYVPVGGSPRRKASGVAVLTGILVAVIVVVVVVVLALSLSSGPGYRPLAADHGTLYIKASSTHVYYTVSVSITVDGQSVLGGYSLSPGYYVSVNEPVSWSGQNCESHYVVATSTGGGFGSQSDSATPTLCDGQDVEVDLDI